MRNELHMPLPLVSGPAVSTFVKSCAEAVSYRLGLFSMVVPFITMRAWSNSAWSGAAVSATLGLGGAPLVVSRGACLPIAKALAALQWNDIMLY